MNDGMRTVVIDAGHGGNDPGAVNGNNREKDFTLKIANYIYKRLNELGIPAVMTREEDLSLPKTERINKVNQISNSDPNTILISNHINAGGGEGAEVVYALRNNSTLADMILDNIGEAGQIKRKTYQRRLPENPNRDYYYIIRDTAPRESVLIEYGFIDNPRDLTKLQNDSLLYAEGVVKALADYMGVNYTLPGQNNNENGNGNNIPDPSGVYIVKRGDTLYSIARKYNISVDELKRLNGLVNNNIMIGQQLLVPNNSNNTDSEYIVQKGDSLWKIAQIFNVGVNDLINYNNLNNSTIYVGDKILIPTNNIVTDTIYVVKPGDTLYAISRRYNIPIDSIIALNNLQSTILFPNQQLIIPKN